MIGDHSQGRSSALAELCRQWHIAELAVFGSVARGDDSANSDIDLLVRFEPDEQWSLLDLAKMVIDFENFFGRSVDLVEERQLVNPFKRKAILEGRRILYAA